MKTTGIKYLGWQEMNSGLRALSLLVRTQLWAQVLTGMALGIAVGLLLSPDGAALVSEKVALTVAEWVRVPGGLFLALIQMVVIPLVVSSVALGIGASDNPVFLRRLGLRVFPFFLLTTLVAVLIGLGLALWVEPGNHVDRSNLPLASGAATDSVRVMEQGSVAEQLVALIPTNIFQAALEQSMLHLVIYAIITGIALASLSRSRVAPLLDWLQAIQDVSMKVVSWAMMLAPWAVFGLLCDITLRTGLDTLLGVSVYVLTVMAGLLAMLLMFAVIAALGSGRTTPWRFLANVRAVQLLAFSTSSSAAVMPLSLQVARERLAVQPAVSDFVIPLGATVNMAGTALYQVVATVFLAQVFQVEMGATALILLMVTVIGASVGAPSTPGVGIVILATLLENAGIPASGIALVLGVDRILDMSRTTVNVTGDLAACVVMNRWLGEVDAGSADAQNSVSQMQQRKE
jgi:proton glutamate symport protein